MNLNFEEVVFAGLVFLAGLFLGMLLRGGDKWRKRYDDEHERFITLEAERDGWRARHQALDGEREAWARERAEWERHRATAPDIATSHHHGTGIAPAAGAAAMAAGVGTAALHGHPDNVAPLHRGTTVERTTEVRRLDPSEVREVELGDARRIDDATATSAREGFAPSYPQRSEIKPD